MGRKKSANKKEKHDFHDDYSSRIMGTFDETEVLNDEEDAFHASREKVTLDSTSLSQSSLKSNFFDEEDAVLEVDGADDSESSHDDNLQDGEGSSDSDQEADEEALQTIMRKLPSLQKKIGHEDIESDDGDGQCLRFSNLLDDSVVDDKAWGPKKSLYYNADADLDEDADAEEEQEALRIQADRMQEMNAADFMDDFDDSFAAQLENGNTENYSPSPDDNAIEFLHNGTSTSRPDSELEKMDKDQLMTILKSESHEIIDLLSDFTRRTKEVNEMLLPLLESINQLKKMQHAAVDENAQGVSFLEAKCQLMLTYLTNLTYYLHLRTSPQEQSGKIEDHPVIKNLVEFRVAMEKMKPIEMKLKYQIDKLLKLASSADSTSASTPNPINGTPSELQTTKKAKGVDVSDPLLFKANPHAFVEEGDDMKDPIDIAQSSTTYRPPKISSTPYPHARSKAPKSERTEEALRDIQSMLSSAPETIIREGDQLMTNDEIYGARALAAKEQLEEDLMVRFPVTRKEKRIMGAKKRVHNELAAIDDFSAFEHLHASSRAEDEDAPSRKLFSSSSKAASSNDFDMENSLHESHKKRRGPIMLNEISKSTRAELPVDDENNFYQDVKQKSLDKRNMKLQQKKTAQPWEPMEDFAVDPSKKRQINYEMLKNKGLMPTRTKEQRNPRLKNRVKYEKSMIKIKSVKPSIQEKKSVYGGESTGIKKNLSRSVHFE